MTNGGHYRCALDSYWTSIDCSKHDGIFFFLANTGISVELLMQKNGWHNVCFKDSENPGHTIERIESVHYCPRE